MALKTRECPEEMAFVLRGQFEMGEMREDSVSLHPIVEISHDLCVDRHEFVQEDLWPTLFISIKQFDAIPIGCVDSTPLPFAGRFTSAQKAWDFGRRKVDFETICGWQVRPVVDIPMPSSFDVPEVFRGARRPLIANWHQADAICKLQGKRLPTEAEWEYIAKGESHQQLHPTNDGEWPYDSEGRHRRAVINKFYMGNDGTTTEDVCSYQENSVLWGGKEICDMAGNVAEWVSDWYQDFYQPSELRDPSGPLIGSAKVLRGESWATYSMPTDFSTTREVLPPEEFERTDTLGGFCPPPWYKKMVGFNENQLTPEGCFKPRTYFIPIAGFRCVKSLP